MASYATPTTLADERRYRRALSQQRTAPSRVHEETYDSSSDEEDDIPEPHETGALDGTQKNKGNQTKEAEDAALAAEYAAKSNKRPRRIKPLLTPALLTDPETGLGQLLHKQPTLRQEHSIPAAAAYTRKLFALYHNAMHQWTDGNAMPNDTQWMTQMESLASKKLVRDHLDTLRQVICRQFVEQKVGLETADRWFSQWAIEQAAVADAAPPDDADAVHLSHGMPPEAPADTGAAHTGCDPPPTIPVSPTPGHSSPRDVRSEDEEQEFDSPNAAQPKRSVEAIMPEAAAPAPKRRVLADDDTDEELEFGDTQETESETNLLPEPKRRVLDDSDDDDDDDDELNDSETPRNASLSPTRPAQSHQPDAMETNTPTELVQVDKSHASASEKQIVADNHVEEAIQETEVMHEPGSQSEGTSQATQKENTGEHKQATDPSGHVTFANKATTLSSSTNEESPITKKTASDPDRFEVLEELTQPSSPQHDMALGQPSQLAATQPATQEEDAIFDETMTQSALGLVDDRASPHQNVDDCQLPRDTEPLPDETTLETHVAAQETRDTPMASAPQSPQDDDTVIVPPLSETQDTLVPSTGDDETPTTQVESLY